MDSSERDERHHIKVFEDAVEQRHVDGVEGRPRHHVNNGSSSHAHTHAPPAPPLLDGSSKSRFASTTNVVTAAHVSDPLRWGYAKKYRKYDPDAWREDGSGYLQRSCAVLVHDYADVGVHGSGSGAFGTATSDSAASLHRSNTPPPVLLGGTGKKARAKPAHFCRLEINGRAVVNGSDPTEQEPIVVSSVRELLEKFPDGFFDDRPDWACVRWIDVEGSNGEVIQFLLKSIDCERSQYFQHVVDRKQRSMGLVMDGPDHETKFLFVLKVPSLSREADNQNDVSPDALYALNSDEQMENLPDTPPAAKIVEYEQISFLLALDQVEPDVPGPRQGTMLTIQEGKEGDVFGEVREHLRNPNATIWRRSPCFLLLRLVEASTESAVLIEHFVDRAIDQLKAAMAQQCDSVYLFHVARQFQQEVDPLRRLVISFHETVSEMLDGSFPEDILGSNKGAWSSVAGQMKRIKENLSTAKMDADGCMAIYRDSLARREDERQKQIAANQELIANNNTVMGVVLSIFSPISFVQALYSMQFDTTAIIVRTPEAPSSHWFAPWSWGLSQFAQFWLTCSIITAIMLCIYVHMGLISVENPASLAWDVLRRVASLLVAFVQLVIRLVQLLFARRTPVDMPRGLGRADEETTHFISSHGSSK